MANHNVNKERFIALEKALSYLQAQIKPEYLLSRHENDLSFARLVWEVKHFFALENESPYLPNKIFDTTSQSQPHVKGKILIDFLKNERELLLSLSKTDDYSIEDYCTGFHNRLFTYIDK